MTIRIIFLVRVWRMGCWGQMSRAIVACGRDSPSGEVAGLLVCGLRLRDKSDQIQNLVPE